MLELLEINKLFDFHNNRNYTRFIFTIL